MTWLRILFLPAALAGVLATSAVGCGPEKPYCPDAHNGECLEPTPDGGSGGTSGEDRGAIIFENGTSQSPPEDAGS